MKNPEPKNDASKLPSADVLKAFVKSKNGVIYQVLNHKTKKGVVLLRLKNKYFEMPYTQLKQSVVNGVYSAINEHEWRQWVKDDHEYMMGLSHKLVKRVLLSQLLLELDDTLENDFEGNNYFKNVLAKSKKQCERLVTEQYDKLYETDKTYVTNFMNMIDGFVTKCAQMGVDDFAYLNVLLDKYIANPEQYREEKVELTELDG